MEETTFWAADRCRTFFGKMRRYAAKKEMGSVVQTFTEFLKWDIMMQYAGNKLRIIQEADPLGRIIIFTGKGGVGKTSLAAAHALRSAQEGAKTLLVSTDMAHNIGDVFVKDVGGQLTQLADGLDGLELDPALIMKEDFQNIDRAIGKMLGSMGVPAAKSGNHFIIPGFENLFSLLKIKQLYEKGEYDRIIVDCAPTGETLSLLKLPEMLSWYMEKWFPVGKMMTRVLAPISKRRYHVELPDRKAMNEIEELHRELILLQELLKDDRVCSVRLVCVPEKMVVDETKRSYMYLNLYRYQVDGVYINRILPEHIENEFWSGWSAIQRGYIEELERVFWDLPMTKIPWYQHEVQGEEAIRQIVREELSQQEDLFAVRVHHENETYEKTEDGYQLNVRIPGAETDEVHVAHHNQDVNIRLHNYNRCIPLPDTLRGAEITEQKLEDGVLKLCFRIADKAKGGEMTCGS